MKSNNLHVGTLNVRGLKSRRKRIAIYEWINTNNYDIMLLQETYCSKNDKTNFKSDWNGRSFHSVTDSNHSRGVSILLSENITKLKDFKVLSIYSDNVGRRLIVNISILNVEYSIVNMYCPNDSNERDLFLNKSIDSIRQNTTPNRQLIIGGDFNCVTNKIDKLNQQYNYNSKIFNNFIQQLEVTDIWREQHPDDIEFTYIDPSGRGYSSRIDKILISKSLSKFIINSKITQAPTPDHKAVIINIRYGTAKRGKGYWKLNSSIIEELEYKKMIKHVITMTQEEYGDALSKCDFWQFLKARIKEHSINYCIEKSKNKKDAIKVLENKLDELDKQIAENSKNLIQINNERKIYKESLDNLYAEKAIGAQVRSRAKWIEQGEKSTSYFLNLEKKRQTCNHIQSLKYKDKQAHDNEGILDICNEFYSDLYASKRIPDRDIDEYLNKTKTNKMLSEEEKEICEGKITLDECDNVIKTMKSNKSPGLDGLTAEFYKQFWPLLKNIVVNAFNESYDLACLPTSMRIAIMTLIFKKGDIEDLENYRPISLTNTDYKILAFVLANRVQNVIDKLIDPDQVAYIKKRFIGTNIRLVQDVIETADEGLLFFLDLKKAFDSIEWNFIFKCLKRCNFGDNLINWIKILYTKPMISIKNNGYISDSFEIYRGVRQGCPISCLIFILCVEVLADSIRQNKDLKGIKLDVTNIKISQYADDATVYLKDTEELVKCTEIINEYCAISGMALNMSKCEGLWVGNFALRQNNCNVGNIRWPMTPIKCLGIYVGHNKDECERLNWYSKVNKMESVLECWKSRRNLTLFGKVQVIKCLAMSGLIFTATNCALPSTNIISEINAILYKFLWGRKETLKRNILINSKHDGGIGMIDVKCHFEALKAAWVPRLLQSNDMQHWMEIPRHYIDKFGKGSYILKTTINEKIECEPVKLIPVFYREMIIAFTKSKITNAETFHENILNQTLFGNKFLTYKNINKRQEVQYNTNWINSGIGFFNNLRIRDGIIDENYLYEKIKDKRNIYVEIAQLKKITKKYIVGITHEPENQYQDPS